MRRRRVSAVRRRRAEPEHLESHASVAELWFLAVLRKLAGVESPVGFAGASSFVAMTMAAVRCPQFGGVGDPEVREDAGRLKLIEAAYASWLNMHSRSLPDRES